MKKRKHLKRYLSLYVMALPGLIYLFINNFMPLPGLVLAFKKYNAKKGIFGSPFVGLKNFKYLFVTKDAFIITRNTILYNLAFIVINTILAIAVAILLAEMTSKMKKVQIYKKKYLQSLELSILFKEREYTIFLKEREHEYLV